MPYDASPDRLDQKVVFQFFWEFSVFECALKREGFLRSRRDGGVEPDWLKFGKSIRGHFANVNRHGFPEAVSGLMKFNPRQQIVCNGRLNWREIERKVDESDEEYVIRLLKAVRNNLFHGGKYPDGDIVEVARDREILEVALSVLRGCCELHPGISLWVNGAAA